MADDKEARNHQVIWEMDIQAKTEYDSYKCLMHGHCSPKWVMK